MLLASRLRLENLTTIPILSIQSYLCKFQIKSVCYHVDWVNLTARSSTAFLCRPWRGKFPIVKQNRHERSKHVHPGNNQADGNGGQKGVSEHGQSFHHGQEQRPAEDG